MIKTVQRSGYMIAFLEEEAIHNGWITLDQLQAQAQELKQTDYGKYLLGLVGDMR